MNLRSNMNKKILTPLTLIALSAIGFGPVTSSASSVDQCVNACLSQVPQERAQCDAREAAYEKWLHDNPDEAPPLPPACILDTATSCQFKCQPPQPSLSQILESQLRAGVTDDSGPLRGRKYQCLNFDFDGRHYQGSILLGAQGPNGQINSNGEFKVNTGTGQQKYLGNCLHSVGHDVSGIDIVLAICLAKKTGSSQEEIIRFEHRSDVSSPGQDKYFYSDTIGRTNVSETVGDYCHF